METGYDILFFWVARMVMDGLFFTGKAPFHTVYLHGMVRDDKGQKMSKTKNNVIDPLVLMNEYGTDALRFSLVVGSSSGSDQNVGVKKVEGNRNFANKVWNIGRFVINAVNKVEEPIKAEPQWTLADSGFGHAPSRRSIALTTCLRLTNLARLVDRFMNFYGMILPTGISKLRSGSWLKAVTGLRIPRLFWRTCLA